jgi:hypothetical protein
MFRKCCFATIVLVMALLAGVAGIFNTTVAAQSFAGQSLNNSEAETYSLRGTVVNSVTGEGVSGALVRIYLGEGRAVRADAAGKFEIAALHAGTAAVHVSKPGYFGTEDTPRLVPPISAVIGPDSTPLLLNLVPEGMIYGQISGADGEPISGIQIQILQQRVMNGRSWRFVTRSLLTDDEGRFRAAELRPGKYFLMAGPENLRELANGADSSTSTQYGAMFYPGVPEFSEAAAIQIAPGQRAETDFKLAHQPLYSVSGVVNGGPPGCKMQLAVLNDIGHGIGNYFVNPNTGEFDAANVPSSASSFAAICHDKNERTYSGETGVKLSSNVANLRVTVVPWADIPIRVSKENTNDQPAEGPGQRNPSSGFVGAAGFAPIVELLAEDYSDTTQMEYYSEAVGKTDDTLQVIKSVQPGRYDLRGLAHGHYYVESARSGTVDLFKESLSVGGGAVAPVEIVLRDDAASLTISPQQNGASVPATLLVWPEEAPRLIQERKRFQGVPPRPYTLKPGTYRVLALPTGSSPEYRSSEFLQRYAAQWQEITLAANQTATLVIELAKEPD